MKEDGGSSRTKAFVPARQIGGRYWAQKILNGGIAGIIGVTCVFPMDLVKTRLQNQQPGPDGKLLYRGFTDCFRQTISKEGFFGMYRGSAVNLVMITPEKAIKLVCNDFFRHIYKNSNGQLTKSREVLAGASAGFCQIIVTTPMELLKIQQQDAGRSGAESQNKKLTARQVALDLWRQKGIRGIYKGHSSTMLRDVTFSAIYFPLFAHLNALGKRKENSNEAVFYHTLISGIIAGAIASFVVNPFDVVKTRLQTITKGKTDKTYTGIPDCFRKTFATEGIKAFYKGGLARVIVIAPLFGIAQTVYYLGAAETLFGFYDRLTGIK